MSDVPGTVLIGPVGADYSMISEGEIDTTSSFYKIVEVSQDIFCEWRFNMAEGHATRKDDYPPDDPIETESDFVRNWPGNIPPVDTTHIPPYHLVSGEGDLASVDVIDRIDVGYADFTYTPLELRLFLHRDKFYIVVYAQTEFVTTFTVTASKITLEQTFEPDTEGDIRKVTDILTITRTFY